MSGSDRPRPLNRFPAEWIDGLKKAYEKQDQWFVLTTGIPDANLRTKYNWTTSMKKGLINWRGANPELSKAALEGRIRFRKDRQADGRWKLEVMVKESPLRPSDIAREWLEQIAAGKPVPPPVD